MGRDGPLKDSMIFKTQSWEVALPMETWEVGFQDSKSPFTTLILMWVPRFVSFGMVALGAESTVIHFLACFLPHKAHCMVTT